MPYGEFFFDEALPRLERVLKVAILRRGVPEALYVDNGQIFNATQFRAACASLQIEVIFASPYHPQGYPEVLQIPNSRESPLKGGRLQANLGKNIGITFSGGATVTSGHKALESFLHCPAT